MEELKLILQTVSDLGEGAKWLFVFYIIKELMIYIIGFSCLGGGLIGAYKIIKSLIPAFDFMERVKVIAGTGSWMGSREKEHILGVLRKHYN